MCYFAKKNIYLIIFKGFTLFQENWGTPQPVPWAIAYSPWWAIAYSPWWAIPHNNNGTWNVFHESEEVNVLCYECRIQHSTRQLVT